MYANTNLQAAQFDLQLKYGCKSVPVYFKSFYKTIVNGKIHAREKQLDYVYILYGWWVLIAHFCLQPIFNGNAMSEQSFASKNYQIEFEHIGTSELLNFLKKCFGLHFDF